MAWLAYNYIDGALDTEDNSNLITILGDKWHIYKKTLISPSGTLTQTKNLCWGAEWVIHLRLRFIEVFLKRPRSLKLWHSRNLTHTSTFPAPGDSHILFIQNNWDSVNPSSQLLDQYDICLKNLQVNTKQINQYWLFWPAAAVSGGSILLITDNGMFCSAEWHRDCSDQRSFPRHLCLDTRG